MKVVIVDDQAVVRAGLRMLLAQSQFDVVGEATNCDQALEVVAAARPDVVLLDVIMPKVGGLKTLARLRDAFPELPVVMFSAFENPAFEARALALGAVGYVLKGASRDELTEEIRRAAAGERLWTRTDLRRLSGYTASAEPIGDGEIPLTPRETEVLRLVCGGATNKKISDQLGISTETVKEHVQHVLRKLGVSDRTQAAVWAVRQGVC